MNKLGICALLLAITASQAYAANNGIFYIAGKFGGSHGQAHDFTASEGFTLDPDNFNENVYAWGGAVGYTYKHWPTPLRMEVEYLYRNHYPYSAELLFDGAPSGVSEEQHTNTQTILANFYLDIPVTRMFAFFVGGGLGEAMSTTYSKSTIPLLGEVTSRDDDTGFSWMATGGFTVTPIKWLSLDLSYRYSGLNSIIAKAGTTVTTDDFNAQEIFLGIRVLIPDLYKDNQSAHYTAPPVTNQKANTLDK